VMVGVMVAVGVRVAVGVIVGVMVEAYWIEGGAPKARASTEVAALASGWQRWMPMASKIPKRNTGSKRKTLITFLLLV